MVSLWATALAVPVAVSASPHPLVDVFVSACVDGKLRLPTGAARKIVQKELPPVLRRQYSAKWPDASFYELSQPSRAYLLILRDKAQSRRSIFDEICTVAAPGLPYRQGYDHVMRLTIGNVPKREADTALLLEFHNAQSGYVFSARDLGSGWGSLKIAHPTKHYRMLPDVSPAITTSRVPSVSNQSEPPKN